MMHGFKQTRSSNAVNRCGHGMLKNRCGRRLLTSCCVIFLLGRVRERCYGDVDGSDEVRELRGSRQRFTTTFCLRLLTRPVLSVRGCGVENAGTASVGAPTHRQTNTEANTQMQSHRLRHKLRHKRSDIQAHPFQSRRKNRWWLQAQRNLGTPNSRP